MKVFPRITKSHRQTLAAMSSSGAQDRPSSPGFHPCPESMGTLTLDIAWLKSTFAHFSLPLCPIPCQRMDRVKSSGLGEDQTTRVSGVTAYLHPYNTNWELLRNRYASDYLQHRRGVNRASGHTPAFDDRCASTIR